ncbi:MAG: tetratricopeptide repeat protein [Vicinamibacterales bacterium]
MRRTLLAIVLVAGTGVAAALAYQAFANERDFDRLIAEGDRAVAQERHFQSIEAYSGAIALKPDSMLAHLKRGSVYQQQGELEAALRDLREATEIDPTAPRPLELLGDVNVAMGRPESAIERYERYIGLDERNARVLYKLGVARYRAGMVTTAAEPLHQALQLDPTISAAHYMLGLVERDQNQLAPARASLQQALRMDPGSPTTREALAEVLALDGEHAKAIEQLQALAALDPSRPDRLIAVGLAQARAGRQDAAVLTLSGAVDRFPDASQAYAALGHVWLAAAQNRGDRVSLKKALEALTTAATRSDASSETLAELGHAWMMSGNPQEAERMLRQAVSRLPVSADAYLRLAAVTERDGRIQDARDALMKYATLMGDAQPIAGVATRIADLSMKLGEPAIAVRWFDRALDEAGPTSVLLAKLDDAALKAGNIARARQAVDEGLAAEPNDRPLQQLKRRLPPG